MKLTREIKAGLIVVGGIVLFILGFTFLKSSNIFNASRTFYAVYSHSNGLTKGVPVTINGLNVGHVEDVRFMDETGRLLVTFIVTNKIEFSKNSIAEIYDSGIIGSKNLQVILVNDGSLLSKSGDTLPSRIKPGLAESITSQLTPLQESIEKVLKNADSVIVGVDDILDTESRASIKTSLKNLENVITNFDQASNILHQILSTNKTKLENTLESADNLSTNLSLLSDTLASANLGKTFTHLQHTSEKMDALMTRLDSGEGSLGKLLNDEQLYTNLANASLEIELLLEDLRLNPKRYVHFSLFGKGAKPYEEEINEPIKKQ